MAFKWEWRDIEGTSALEDEMSASLYVDGLRIGEYYYNDHTLGENFGVVSIDPYYRCYTVFGTGKTIPDDGDDACVQQAKEWIRKTAHDEIKKLFQIMTYAMEENV